MRIYNYYKCYYILIAINNFYQFLLKNNKLESVADSPHPPREPPIQVNNLNSVNHASPIDQAVHIYSIIY